MAKDKPKKVASEKEIQARREFDMNDSLKSFVPYPPKSRLFKVGDIVQYGSHPNCSIQAVLDSGRVYEIKTWGDYKVYSSIVYAENFSFVTWDHLLPISCNSKISKLIQNEGIRLNYSNMMIDSMIHTVYYSGLDLNPIYQRDYVWTEEDQVSLIDSIFCNRTIGSYIICFLGYSSIKCYEVLDGKQRIKAIMDFYEDKFPYKGKLYTELSNSDRHHFENFAFPRAQIEQPTLEQKIKIFLHVNTTGKHMSEEHLEKVKGMLICQ